VPAFRLWRGGGGGRNPSLHRSTERRIPGSAKVSGRRGKTRRGSTCLNLTMCLKGGKGGQCL